MNESPYRATPEGGIEVVRCSACGSEDIEVSYGASTNVLCHDCGATSSERL